MEKQKFYVSIGSQEISQIKYGNNEAFMIYATDHEVRSLRARLDDIHGADLRTFYRSHVPIMPYHNDKANDDYDSNITEAFQMIYELGDRETKTHIENMGILADRHL